MSTRTADLVICGAGMAGIAAAYHLAVRQGLRNIVLVDERAPLTLTSDKGTAAYRNWWPSAAMVSLVNRSIDLLEELALASGQYFEMNRRGYVFVTAKPGQIPLWQTSATEIGAFGAGPLRRHPGPSPFTPALPEGLDAAEGADLVTDRDQIRAQYPFLTPRAQALLHVRRCGWLDALKLGGWLLEQAQAHGVRLVRARIEGVKTAGGRVQRVQLGSGELIDTANFVIAAGPYLKQVAGFLGVELPVFCELHAKIALRDPLSVIPRTAPLMIWSDPVRLSWSEAEREEYAARPETRWLLEELPAGVHFRPRGGPDKAELLLIWTYDVHRQEPVWPPTFDPIYPEVLLRGLAEMVPGLRAYFGQGHTAYMDGGYYCKTPENRPLIGPLPVEGAFVIGALGGFGVMASQAAAELLASHVTGEALPAYAPDFRLERYDDPNYAARAAEWDSRTGQL